MCLFEKDFTIFSSLDGYSRILRIDFFLLTLEVYVILCVYLLHVERHQVFVFFELNAPTFAFSWHQLGNFTVNIMRASIFLVIITVSVLIKTDES